MTLIALLCGVCDLSSKGMKICQGKGFSVELYSGLRSVWMVESGHMEENQTSNSDTVQRLLKTFSSLHPRNFL